MSRTITIGNRVIPVPPYQIGDRVEVLAGLGIPHLGWCRATVVGVSAVGNGGIIAVTNDASPMLRCWLDDADGRTVWDFALTAVRPLPAIDQLAELA